MFWGRKLFSLSIIHRLVFMNGTKKVQVAFWAVILVRVQFFIHQYLQALLHLAALNPFITQSAWMFEVALTQLKHLTLALELHEICTGQPLKPFQVPLVASLPFEVLTAPLSWVHPQSCWCSMSPIKI